MKYKILSITSILVLVLVVTLLFSIKIPLCYNLHEDKPSPETFILYDSQVVAQVKEQIERSPFHYVRVNGQSMYHSIKHSDMCVCLPQNNYKKGDMVSFYIPVNDQVELIIHRIIKEENNHFLTKGDANNIEDSWLLDQDQIFCKVPEKNLFDKFRFAIVESEGRFSVFSIFG